jgi:hypothetical protein
MKRSVLVGVLVGAMSIGTAFAQTAPASKPARAEREAADRHDGHSAPKQQPETAPTPTVPTGDMALGLVHLGKGVKADGKALAAGTYQVRLTAQQATPDAKGETPSLERWVEFVQKGQVKGREVVTIVPQSEIALVQKDAPPHANAAKVEMLKGGNYMRLWINKGGNHYLVHFPVA